MKKLTFEQTPFEGVWVVSPNPHVDNRGEIVRTFCRNEYAEQGIELHIAQCNVSFNTHAGTLRGMHCQLEPCAEIKLVRCGRGRLFDVIVDMRPGSATYRKHFSVELSFDNMKTLVITEGFFHGYLTLEDHTDVHYMVNNFYTPEYGRGLRYNDPALEIEWPRPIETISEQDKNWPLLEDLPHDYSGLGTAETG